MNIIYDIETYPNCFTFAAEHTEYPLTWSFEISDRRNNAKALVHFLKEVVRHNGSMIGFNNVGFDYPVLHMLILNPNVTALTLYKKAMAIIEAQDENRFAHMVFPSDRFVPQIDLYKIHHFDNRARSTSLKVLEFNMRADNVSDLPFPVGTTLDTSQIEVLHTYNAHDVTMTKKFYHESTDLIAFRRQLTEKHNRDFMNHSDVKIGKEIFQMGLEKVGVSCYVYGSTGRTPNQTKRPFINIDECIPPFIAFDNPEFNRVLDWMRTQVITETKGSFKDVVAHVGGLDFIFGTGGIHASVENRIFEANDEMMILDVDVTSLYPSIAIEHGYYPEHLGKTFVDVYRKMKEQRVSYKKGTPENAMLKLALNGVYGASNDKFSVFYDPLFTMKITIAGQLMLCMLIEALLSVKSVEIISCNTDGICMYLPRSAKVAVDAMCRAWEQITKLHLEEVTYRKMIAADVNSYIAIGTDGKTKRKGRYEYDLEWHQNHSALVVPKVAEKVLVEGCSIREAIENWPDMMDFMLRIKVPRTSRLVSIREGEEITEQNTCRYYVSPKGVDLIKIMPPLKGKDTERRFAVEKGWKVCVCNNIKDAYLPVDYAYYINEVEKLVLRMK